MFQKNTPQFPDIHAEQHEPIAHWAKLWGFSSKTVRTWFRDEHGPGILRIANVDRRTKRDYTTLTISPSAAARVYAQRVGKRSDCRRREVM
jgi:hypothetical protein